MNTFYDKYFIDNYSNCLLELVQNDSKMDKISPPRETYLIGTKDNTATTIVGSEKIKSLDKQPNDKLKLEKKIQLPGRPSNASSLSSDSVSLSPSPRKRFGTTV